MPPYGRQKCSFARETPFLTALAGVQYLLVRPGVTVLTMKSVRVHPNQPEMQNLGGVGFSALKYDWVHSKRIKYSTGVGTQIIYFPLGFGINRGGVTLFSLFSLGCTPMNPGAPRCTAAVAVRLGVVRIRKWATIRGPIRVTSTGPVSWMGRVGWGKRTFSDRFYGWVG